MATQDQDVRRIPVAYPDLQGNEMKYVTDCITTEWVSSQGPYVKRFEDAFAEWAGVEHAITCSTLRWWRWASARATRSSCPR